MPLQIHSAADHEQMSRQAARVVIRRLQQKPDLLLCASAGGTPTRMYEILAQRCQDQPGLFSDMRVLTVDEWGGLPAGHPATCKEDIRTKLMDPCHIRAARFCAFKTDSSDPGADCDRMSRWLAKNGPIDLCVLGLGLNGHIAMLEPADELPTLAHVAKLAPSSLKHPMLRGSGRVPAFGMSLGLGEIMNSAEVLLLVSGARKSPILHKVLRQAVATRLPASLLHLHPNAHVFYDRAAAALAS